MASKFNIQRYKTTVTVVPGATAVATTTPALNYPINGLLRQVNVQTPAAVDASATMSLQLIDTDGFKVYDSATTWAVNTKNMVLLTNPVPLANIATVQITFSANQTTTASVTTVSLLIDRG